MIELLLGPLGGILAALAGAVALWLHGRSTGKQAEVQKQVSARVKAIESSKRIETAVTAGDPAANRGELKKWGR